MSRGSWAEYQEQQILTFPPCSEEVLGSSIVITHYLRGERKESTRFKIHALNTTSSPAFGSPWEAGLTLGRDVPKPPMRSRGRIYSHSLQALPNFWQGDDSSPSCMQHRRDESRPGFWNDKNTPRTMLDGFPKQLVLRPVTMVPSQPKVSNGNRIMTATLTLWLHWEKSKAEIIPFNFPGFRSDQLH